MKIGIVGGGKVGSALGSWAAKLGDAVVFNAASRKSAEKAAAHAGHGARASDLSELIEESELIFLALPFAKIEEALAPVSDLLASKIIVDVTNPITPDHRDLTIGHTDSGAETIARAHPKARIVKAFNATFAEVYAAQTAELGGSTLSILYAGDEQNSKAQIRDFIERLGFDAVDAGPLKNARYLEPLSLMNIHLGRFLGLGTSIGFSLARDALT